MWKEFFSVHTSIYETNFRNFLCFQNQCRMQYPHLTEDQLNQATRAYMMQIQSGFTGNTAAYDKSYYQQVSHMNNIVVKGF